MRIPRDLTGDELAKLLHKLGYIQTRQVGSHLRLTTQAYGTHHITIPRHDPLKVGTLSGILHDVAVHFGKTREELLLELF